MYDVTTIGSALQDIYVFSDKFSVHADPRKMSGKSEYFEFGTKIELDDLILGVGGGASNAAFTFRNQGLKCACLARVGDDGVGMEVRKRIKEYGVTDKLIIDKNNRTGRSIFFLGKSGEKTVLVFRGAAKKFKPSEITKKNIPQSKWFYVTSLGGDMASLKKVFSQAKLQKTNIMINPGKREIEGSRLQLLKLLKQAKVLLLNREEASLLVKKAYGNVFGIMNELKKLLPNTVLLVTDGDKGLYTIMENHVNYVIIKPVKAVDMTGAGDAFGSGFLAGYIRSQGDVKKGLHLAVNNSTSVVQKIGAKHGLAKKLKMNNKLKLNYKLKKIYE